VFTSWIKVKMTELERNKSFEILTEEEFARRLKISIQWVKRHKRPSRTADPIPYRKVGRGALFINGSPELGAWLRRNFGLEYLPSTNAGSTSPEGEKE
jgi:hypothetical protein